MSHGRKVEGKLDVDSLVKKLNPKLRELAEKLRVIVKKTLPNAVETVKWGNPTYIIDGKNVTWLLTYRDHVDLGFFKGAQLKSKLLEGTGKGLRHIKVRTVADIQEEEFSRLLREAAKIA